MTMTSLTCNALPLCLLLLLAGLAQAQNTFCSDRSFVAGVLHACVRSAPDDDVIIKRRAATNQNEAPISDTPLLLRDDAEGDELGTNTKYTTLTREMETSELRRFLRLLDVLIRDTSSRLDESNDLFQAAIFTGRLRTAAELKNKSKPSYVTNDVIVAKQREDAGGRGRNDNKYGQVKESGNDTGVVGSTDDSDAETDWLSLGRLLDQLSRIRGGSKSAGNEQIVRRKRHYKEIEGPDSAKENHALESAEETQGSDSTEEIHASGSTTGTQTRVDLDRYITWQKSRGARSPRRLGRSRRSTLVAAQRLLLQCCLQGCSDHDLRSFFCNK